MFLTFDSTTVVTLVGILIPILTGLISKKVASGGLKSILTLVLSVLVSVIATLVASDGHGFAWHPFATAFISTFVVAIASYYGFWKPTGLAGSVAQATQSFGISRPVLQTAAKGEESPSSAAGNNEKGAASVGVLLLVLGLVFVILALLVVSLHVLLWVGVVLAIVGAVFLLVGNSRGVI